MTTWSLQPTNIHTCKLLICPPPFLLPTYFHTSVHLLSYQLRGFFYLQNKWIRALQGGNYMIQTRITKRRQWRGMRNTEKQGKCRIMYKWNVSGGQGELDHLPRGARRERHWEREFIILSPGSDVAASVSVKEQGKHRPTDHSFIEFLGQRSKPKQLINIMVVVGGGLWSAREFVYIST